MIGFKVDQAKGMFFDRKAVTDSITKDEKKRLTQFGAGVRKAAQKSIKMGVGSAPAGQPPHGHASGMKVRKSKSTGKVREQKVSLLREFLYFVFERENRSVIIGPARLNNVTGDAPAALEAGGPSVIKSFGNLKSVTIKPHPYMQPAFDAELPKVPSLWAG